MKNLFAREYSICKMTKREVYGMEKYVIFGAANKGTEVYRLVKKLGEEVKFFVDNDEKRWGSKEGIEVIGAHELVKRDPNRKCKIIVASVYYDEIRKQLLEMGFAEDNIITLDRMKSVYHQKEYEDFRKSYRIMGRIYQINSIQWI